MDSGKARSRRVEYVCKGYHRKGKEFYSSHRIREECLDEKVVQYAQTLREIAQLREQIRQHEEDIDELLMLRIRADK